MKGFQPYLNFDGTCHEAMTFYHQCLGGELYVQTFADAKVPGPPGSESRVVHANIRKGNAVLMASDTMPGHPSSTGTNVHVNVDCESRDELDKAVAGLSQGGTITMPPGEMFWGAYFAMLTDKYGIQWMFNFDQTQAS